MDRALRLVVVEDQPIMRRGLVTVLELEPGFQVVGQAATGQDGVRLARETRPDVVLMDLQLPGLNGVEATRQIVAERLARVLILTTFDTEDFVLDGIGAGAAGYVLKDVEADVLCRIVRRVAQGDEFVQPEVAMKYLRRLAAGPAGRAAPPPGAALTPRELEVLRLLAEGKSNREIGERLFIAESTVKTHVNAILGKLRVANRTAAAVVARPWLLAHDAWPRPGSAPPDPA
jgi:DNA-binding NarL/FixJ family response regulator